MRFLQMCCGVSYLMGVVVTSAVAQDLKPGAVLPLSPQSLGESTQTAGMRAEDFQRIALERNAELQATRQDIAGARGFLTQSRLRPNPGVDFSFTSGRPLGSPGERSIDIGYAHTIQLGGKRARRIDVAQVGIEVAELLASNRQRVLRTEIHTRYAEALAAARNVATLGELFELNQRSFKVAAERVSEGEGALLEQRLLEVEVGRIAADRFVAAGAAERAFVALKVAAGIAPSEPLALAGELATPAVDLTMDQAIDRALAERPDAKAARAEETRAEAELRLARAERTPDVIGVVRYSQNSSRFNQLGTTPTGQLVPLRDTDHALTAGVSIPLPFANRNQGAIETAGARRRAAALRREFIEQSVRGEVRGAFAQYVGARQAVDVFDRQVIRQAQQTVNTMRTSYELGETRLLDLVQEQRRLVEIQKAFTDALKELYVARATLEQAVGTELR
ncbi:MAG: TolC family protein [Cyanobacteria bacterium]|nr:TolC family protein [Cyanobacteriota bacterium]